MKTLKKCPVCGIQYQDSQDFCSKCGAKLEVSSFEVVSKPKDKPDISDWGGLLIGILAFFLGYEESVLLGGIVAVAGIIYGSKSRYTFLKVDAYVINIIVLLRCIFSL